MTADSKARVLQKKPDFDVAGINNKRRSSRRSGTERLVVNL